MNKVSVNNSDMVTVRDMRIGEIGIIEEEGTVILRTRAWGVILATGAVIGLDPCTSPNPVRVLQRGASVTLTVE